MTYVQNDKVNRKRVNSFLPSRPEYQERFGSFRFEKI